MVWQIVTGAHEVVKTMVEGVLRMRRASAFVGWWITAVFSVAGVAAADDGPLVEAVKNGDTEAVLALLQQEANVNVAEPDGATALHWGVQRDDVELAALLIRAGANVSAASDYGITPLLLASTNGSATMLEALLEAGADPNGARPTGETALMIAARVGTVDAVSALLAHGADVHAKEPWWGQTALMWAAAEGHSAVVRLLIEHRSDVHARSDAGFTPLLFAARTGELDTTGALLTAGADVNAADDDGMTALLVATVRGHTAYAEFLLDQGADPNRGPGYTPLHWAVGEWHTDLTGSGIGITSDTSEWTALGGLRGQEKLNFVKLLLARGADVNAPVEENPQQYGPGGGGVGDLVGGTPFLIATSTGDMNVLRLLLDSGADPSVETDDGVTPLMLAAGLGRQTGTSYVTEDRALEATKLVLQLGGEVNAVTQEEGQTALHGAAYQGWDSIVQLLVDNGAELNVKNAFDWTPLTITEGVDHSGAFIIHESTRELLRKLGAAPSLPDVNREERDVPSLAAAPGP